MKKLIPFFLLILIVSGCDQLGSTKVKNLIDLTPKLKLQSSVPIKITEGKKNPYSPEKLNSYNISNAPIISEPAIAKKILYSVNKKGYVTAFSIKDRKILWTTDIAVNDKQRNFFNGGILHSNGKLFVTYGTRYLVILDAVNGREIIRKEFPDILRAKPIMTADNLLIVQTISNQLIAYNVQNAKFMWMHEGGLETISSKAHIHPVLYDDIIIASYSSGEVIAVAAKSGQEKWRYSLVNFSDVRLPGFEPAVVTTNPIILNNNAYFATSTGKIIKLNLQTGVPLWIEDAEDVQSMALHQNTLFITNNARQVAALSIEDGKVGWIGDLMSEKEKLKRKPKPALFQTPFVSVEEQGFALNVIANNGELYKFITDQNGFLSAIATVVPIEKNVKYYWLSCCDGKLHFITDRAMKF